MFVFTKIADADTEIPTQTAIPEPQNSFFANVSRFVRGLPDQEKTPPEPRNSFSNFSPPAIVGDRVVFSGSPPHPFETDTQTYQAGIYAYHNGVLEVIADTQTPVPDQDATFGGFHTALAVSSEAIAFVGVSRAAYPRPLGELDMGMIAPQEPHLKDWGIYCYHNGTVQAIVDVNTRMPNTDLKFGFFGTPSLVGTDVVFWGKSAGPEGYIPGFTLQAQPFAEGIYRWHQGMLEVIADLTTALPDPDKHFGSFIECLFTDRHAVYFGAGIQQGNSISAKFFRAADSITEIRHFSFSQQCRGGGLGGLSCTAVICKQQILKCSPYNAELGLLTVAGESEIVVASGTPVPMGWGYFQRFLELALDRDTLAFVGVSSPLHDPANRQEGIYARLHRPANPIKADPSLRTERLIDPSLRAETLDHLSQALTRVISAGDVLDNKIVHRLCLHPQGIHGFAIAFLVEFSDRTQAIYRADWRQ